MAIGKTYASQHNMIIKRRSLYLMALFYVFAGSMHFIRPQTYLKVMPPFLPWPEALVYITGVLEIVAGLLLLPSITRRSAAWCIIILLIIVFPANLQMMFNDLHENKPRLWLTILRLPFQLVLIWWAYAFTKGE